MTFGEKVKAERTKLGLNQDELAEKIGVTRRVICSYENDKSRPRGTERYKKLAEALNVNVNYLLSEDEMCIRDSPHTALCPAICHISCDVRTQYSL